MLTIVWPHQTTIKTLSISQIRIKNVYFPILPNARRCAQAKTSQRNVGFLHSLEQKRFFFTSYSLLCLITLYFGFNFARIFLIVDKIRLHFHTDQQHHPGECANDAISFVRCILFIFIRVIVWFSSFIIHTTVIMSNNKYLIWIIV